MKLLFVFLFIIAAQQKSLASDDQKSIYSQIPIEEQCKPAYQNGLSVFRDNALRGTLTPQTLEDEILNTEKACQFAFSIGSYDAQSFLAQTYLLEYLLEKENLFYQAHDNKKNLEKLAAYFRAKFIQILIPQADLDLWSRKTTELEVLKNLKEHFYQMAKEKNESIPFGRFLFTALRKQPYTAFDFPQINQVFQYTNNTKVWKPGSYQRKVSGVLKRIQTIATEYMDWKPGIFFAKDSFWYGSLRRVLNDEKSYRELLEEKYFQDIDHAISQASRLHMKMKDLYHVRSIMMEKQIAYIDRDLKVYEKTRYALFAAPLIPLGIALGSAGLAYAGLSTATASTGVLATGGFFTAQNMAALSSLAVLTGMAGYGAYQNLAPVIRGEQPFRVSDTLDAIFATTITSFPIALMAPIVVGGTAHTGKMFIGSVRPFLASIGNLYKVTRTLGPSGLLKTLPKLPIMALKTWGTGWWRNKILFVHYFVNLGVSVVFEIGTREIFMDGEDRFFGRNKDGSLSFNPLDINHNSKYSLISSAVMGAIGMPINVMDNFISRFLMWRSLSVIGGVGTQLLLNGEVDPKKINFDQGYGSTVGTVSGEFSRAIKFSSYFEKMSGKKRTGLLFLFGFAMKTGTAPLSISLREAYEDSDEGFGGLAKELFKKHAQLDLDDYEDKELEEAFLRVEQTNIEDLIKIYQDSLGPQAPASAF